MLLPFPEVPSRTTQADQATERHWPAFFGLSPGTAYCHNPGTRRGRGRGRGTEQPAMKGRVSRCAIKRAGEIIHHRGLREEIKIGPHAVPLSPTRRCCSTVRTDRWTARHLRKGIRRGEVLTTGTSCIVPYRKQLAFRTRVVSCRVLPGKSQSPVPPRESLPATATYDKRGTESQ